MTIQPGQATTVILRSVRTATDFETWAGSVSPPFPAGQGDPEDRNGLLNLQNLAAFALGIHPLTASLEALPSMDREGTDLVFSYSRSKTAVDAALVLWMAPNLAAQAWSGVLSQPVQTGETPEAETWQIRLPLPPGPGEGYLRLEAMQARP